MGSGDWPTLQQCVSLTDARNTANSRNTTPVHCLTADSPKDVGEGTIVARQNRRQGWGKCLQNYHITGACVPWAVLGSCLGSEKQISTPGSPAAVWWEDGNSDQVNRNIEEILSTTCLRNCNLWENRYSPGKSN